jgi:hypothetical protein
LAGRVEYIGFCSVVKLAAITNTQKSVVYRQLPALALFSFEDTAVLKGLLLFAIASESVPIAIDAAVRVWHQ